MAGCWCCCRRRLSVRCWVRCALAFVDATADQRVQVTPPGGHGVQWLRPPAGRLTDPSAKAARAPSVEKARRFQRGEHFTLLVADDAQVGHHAHRIGHGHLHRWPPAPSPRPHRRWRHRAAPDGLACRGTISVARHGDAVLRWWKCELRFMRPACHNSGAMRMDQGVWGDRVRGRKDSRC